ncbi:MAG TPA: ComEC/Rec2 family competence protein [Patescibacteria group bacterium]|nr:ComEC/Rec2 family competence protein [Patescibacteria group bacterium]
MLKEGVEKIIYSKSRTFLWFCFSFIGGVGLASYLEWRGSGNFYLGLSLLIISLLTVYFYTSLSARFYFLLLLFFTFGIFRFTLSQPVINENHLAYYNNQKMTFVGRVVEEPEYKLKDNVYILEATEIPKWGKPISGRVLVRAAIYPEYQYGDVLSVHCKLQSPESNEGEFNYANYLARQSIYTLCYFPQIEKIGDHPGNIFKKVIFSWKKILADKVNDLWPEPEASLMAGLLYGARSGFTPELSDNFSKVGLTHIVAVSGYNISIVATFLMVLFISVGLYRRQAFWFAVIGIIFFVIFTGASASVVRAGIMGIMVLLANQLGRLSRIGNVLVFTAALMLFFNPWILLWDAGFQLSFLATIGLVYIGPILKEKIFNKQIFFKSSKRAWFNAIAEIFVSTLSAIIATLPLILFQFGRLSLVAPLVNILVLWLIPWLMLFGFVALVLGFIFYPVGQLVAWVAGLGLNYIVSLTEYLGGKNWSAIPIQINLTLLILSYLLIIYFVTRFHKNKNPTP